MEVGVPYLPKHPLPIWAGTPPHLTNCAVGVGEVPLPHLPKCPLPTS